MGGYRQQIRQAYRELGRNGRSFDYKEVLQKILDQRLVRAKVLAMAEDHKLVDEGSRITRTD